MGTPNSPDFVLLRWDRHGMTAHASSTWLSELEYHLLLARDLKLIKPKDHEELAQHAIELKRMLTALLQKVNADR